MSNSETAAKSAPGAVAATGAKKQGQVRHEVVLVDRGFIVARDMENVYVWNPATLKWESKLETGGKIEAMEQLEGTITVRTKDKLWLFHPLERRWMGPLNAQVKEVVEYTLKVPAVQQKAG